ncbi:MAG: aspartyl/asparaginyl beta-hydroxylase domain-containing protein [Chitinophagales bacterium]|nr:aspartyl/asparaginyl beta-hydroxylase domain-containing protein [Chitinophagales bacterium]
MKLEPIYFNIYGNWYKGGLPSFMPLEDDSASVILKENYKEIKAEILKFYNTNIDEFEPMYVPHKYKSTNWNVFNLYGFSLRHSKNIERFPKLNSVLMQIPNMVGAQFSVLDPHTKITAHFSGSNSILRYHLGIVIPGKYPELGIRVRNEDKCWKEGEVFAFCESIRHYAWNYTDRKRIVLLVDIIRPEYANRKNYICAASLTTIAMKMFTVRFPITKRFPVWLTMSIFRILLIPTYTLLFMQNNLKIEVSKILPFLKFKIESK